VLLAEVEDLFGSRPIDQIAAQVFENDLTGIKIACGSTPSTGS
jgi:hypothetical protein